MDIRENVLRVRERIDRVSNGGRVYLVAASKMNDEAAVRQAVAAGVDACGENRAQELSRKNALHAYDGAELHFIGRLQKNKLKYLVGVADLIQSVDSGGLLRLISDRAVSLGVTQDVLLEINIGADPAKGGFPPELLPEALASAAELPGIFVRGLMTVPPVCGSPGEARAYFARMRELFVDNGAKKYDNVSMDFLSMGMSADFEAAIAEGANMVRVGSAIFGARNYPVADTGA